MTQNSNLLYILLVKAHDSLMFPASNQGRNEYFLCVAIGEKFKEEAQIHIDTRLLIKYIGEYAKYT